MKIKFTYLEFTLCLSLVCILGAIGGVLEEIFCDRSSALLDFIFNIFVVEILTKFYKTLYGKI